MFWNKKKRDQEFLKDLGDIISALDETKKIIAEQRTTIKNMNDKLSSMEEQYKILNEKLDEYEADNNDK